MDRDQIRQMLMAYIRSMGKDESRLRRNWYLPELQCLKS